MTEERTTGPQTAMDKSFAALRSLGVRRRTDDKWIAGVCSGLADRLGLDPVIVRAALVLLTILGGIGITIYLVAWALLPNDRNEIAAERALRDGHGGSIVLMILAAFALFGGSWWGKDSGFPWGLAFVGLLVWWMVRRSGSNPEADARVRAQQFGPPMPPGPSTTTASWPAAPAGPVGPVSQTRPAAPPPPPPFMPSRPVAPPRPVVPRQPRRRSGGPLMGLLAIGLAVATYGSLLWAGDEFGWTGDHPTIAIAGSLAAVGLQMVVLGFAGWRAGFLAFLSVVLAVSAWTSTVIPSGVDFDGRFGDAVWKPTSIVTAADNHSYRLGAGDGILDLSGMPTEGLSTATPTTATPTPTIPVYVGAGSLKVVVPQGLTVKVVAHVSLGEILLPEDTQSQGQGGTDVSRSVVIGDGPTEVVVNAGVGLGQITVVKE